MKLILIPAFMILIAAFTGIDKLVGRWESPVSPKGNTTGIVFKADSSFEGYVNNKPFVTGTYSLKDDIFTFVDNGCDGKQGTYKITFFSNEDSMRFASIEDGCEERRNGMSKLVLGRKK
jgi:hypothetical protein